MKRDIRAKDLLQVPTAITAVSFASVLAGARHIDTPQGKALVAAGRFGDVVDGFVARKLDMSSDAGAIADVVADKLGMLAISVGMWKHDIAPKSVLAGMAAKHALNAGATLYNGLRDENKRAIRPPISGKYGMAADNVSLLSFAVASELQPGTTGYRLARGLGWAAAAAGAAFGVVSARHYIKGEFDEAQPAVDAAPNLG